MHEVLRDEHFPPLCPACRALLGAPKTADSVQTAECQRCGKCYVKFTSGWLPAGEEFIHYYGRSVDSLMNSFGHSFEDAVRLAKDYFLKFMDPDFCKSLGIPAQDEEFMWHEGDMASRIHYYLVLEGDPDPWSYIQWRAALQQSESRK